MTEAVVDASAEGRGIQAEVGMRCVVCRQADVRPGEATVTLEREGLTLVVKRVPARVCPNCGEECVAEDVTARLLAC